MLFLRSLIFVVLVFLLTVFFATLCLLCVVFNAKRRYDIVGRGWCRTTIYLGKTLCGMDYEVKGWQHLDALIANNTPVILLSKHQSAWETIAFLALMPKRLCYVFKRELLFLPFFGWGIALMNMIHIDRKKGNDAFAHVARQGRERLKEGYWIIMFPEGTRIPVGQVGRYKSGGTRLALDTGATIVPIAHNAGICWPRNQFIKLPGKIEVVIGAPIATFGKTPDELLVEVKNFIETEMQQLPTHV